MKIAYEEHDRRDQRAVPDRVARSSRAMTVGRLVPKLVRPIGLHREAALRAPTDPAVSSGLQLRQHAGEVAHAPMLHQLTIADGEDVAGGEAQLAASGWHAEVNTAMGAGINEAGGDLVVRGDHRLHG